jgi:Tat protein translocase TatB subunit
MFGIGTPELIVILAVALIVLGPQRLPEVARALGKGLAELRRATSGIRDELDNARSMLEAEAHAATRDRVAPPPQTVAQAPPATAPAPPGPAPSPETAAPDVAPPAAATKDEPASEA